jgi:hypothetical protein
VLPEAAVTPGAFRRISSLLQRDDLRTALRRKDATIRALEDALDGATLRIGELEAACDESAADAALARADVRQLLMRSEELHDARQAAEEKVAELEAEREWKPWPPEVRDGRYVEMFLIPTRERSLVRANCIQCARDHCVVWRECGPAYVPPK